MNNSHNTEILERKLGKKLEKGEVCDHKNEKRLCNLRSNLRLLSHADNLHNVKRKAFNNTSGYKGVSKHAQYGLWRARIHIQGKEHVTYHKTRAEASQSYKSMLKKFYPAL